MISQISYGLEVTTGGNFRENTVMQRLQSRAARLALGWKRRDWSLTRALSDLAWLSVPQMAAEATIRGALKTIRTGQPENLYES